jgi:hypothetical protein
MPKSNLSLSNLYRSWSGTGRTSQSSSLNAANGMAGTPVSMSSFSIDGVTATLPFTYIVENTSENVTFAFTGAGLAFNNRVRTQGNNYQFLLDFNMTQYDFEVGTRGQTTAINALNLANSPSYTGSANGNRLSVYFEDGYNSGSTGNYGFENRAEKQIYRVDSYNSINSDILCVATDTQILLADGTSVEAGDLYVGDSIKTFVPEGMPSWLPENDLGEWYWWYHTSASAGEVVDAQVSNIYFSFIDQYVSINDGAIKTTHAHPFYAWDAITNTYQFTRAEDVAEGDKLIKYNNLTGLIEEIDVINVEFHNRNLEIATITVDVAHTFLANGFVSHNKGAASAPIPWQNLTCYLDPQFANSYNVSGQRDLNDLSGNTTGFNLLGGNSNPAKVAPVFNTSTPKSLTFAANKLGVKQPGNPTGTNHTLFNSTTANGYTIIAFVKNSAGTFFRRDPDFLFGTATEGGLVAFWHTTANIIINVGSQTTSGWRMYAVTTGAGTTKIYNNNVEIYTASDAKATHANTSTGDIELMNGNTGELGSFFFYQRALSATEIGVIWNNLKGRYGL